MTPAPDNAPLVSTKRELRNLGANTQATTAELKAFLAELKGHSPQEMLGMVAASQLFRALILSSILVFALILVFTVIPYFMEDEETTNTTAKAEVSQPASVQPAPTEPQPVNPQPLDRTQSDSTLANPTQPDVSALGVNEEKSAPPSVNPLDGSNDNFLDGLDN